MSGICVANMAPPEETYYSHIAHYSTKQKDIYYYIIIIIYYYIMLLNHKILCHVILDPCHVDKPLVTTVACYESSLLGLSECLLSVFCALSLAER